MIYNCQWAYKFSEVLERTKFLLQKMTEGAFHFPQLTWLLTLSCILSHYRVFSLPFLMCYSFQTLFKIPFAHLNLFQQLFVDRLKEWGQQEKQSILSSENLSKTVRNSRDLAGNEGVLFVISFPLQPLLFTLFLFRNSYLHCTFSHHLIYMKFPSKLEWRTSGAKARKQEDGI